MPDDILLTAADCARQIGLTVRSLRVYEARGLLTPRRTAKGWRVYGAAEIARLGQIISLKSMGLSLAQIGAILSPGTGGGTASRETDIGALLHTQAAQLAAKRRDIDTALGRISTLRAALGAGTPLTVADLIALAKETHAMDPHSDTLAWKRYDQMRPRTEIAIEAEALTALPGHYRLHDGSYCAISAENGQLFVQVNAQPRVEIFAEGRDAFFLKAVPAQITVQRTGGGITGLTIHQNGQEISGVATTAEDYETARAALEGRQSGGTPLPESEPALRQIIDEQARGAIDYTRLTPALAELMRPQEAISQQELAKAGALQGMTFRGVNENGFDVFDLHFANSRQVWGIAHDSDGRIDGLFMRAL